MKRNLLLSLMLASSLVPSAWADKKDHVRFEDLPAGVQQRLAQEKKDGTIKKIEHKEKDGRMVYEVEFKGEGKNHDLILSESGEVLQDTRDPVRGAPDNRIHKDRKDKKEPQPDKPRAKVKAGKENGIDPATLPPPVQKALQNRSDLRVIEFQQKKGGPHLYKVKVVENGKQRVLHIDESGQIRAGD